jgi:hypothetical protein
MFVVVGLIIFWPVPVSCLGIEVIQRTYIRFISFVVAKHTVVGIAVLFVLELNFDVSIEQFTDNSTVEIISAVELI